MKLPIPIICLLLTACIQQKSTPPFNVKKIDNGVYLHTSYKLIEGYGWVDSNGLVVVNKGDAFVVDTPWSEANTAELLAWIDTQGFTLKGSVSTHFHDDRTAGIELLNSRSIPTHTSKLTHDILIEKGMPTASHVFHGDGLMLLDGLVEVYFPGAGHSKDNLVVWLPKNNLLFGGCLVRSLDWHTLGYTGDAEVDQWANSVRNVQSKFPNIDMVIPGHGDPSNHDLLTHTIQVATKAVE